jgi:hypothetical protein
MHGFFQRELGSWGWVLGFYINSGKVIQEAHTHSFREFFDSVFSKFLPSEA